MKRLFRAIWWTGAAVAVFVTACVLWAIPAAWTVDSLGNGKITGPQTTSTRIAVFGDTQKGLAAFAELANRAKAEHIDLAVHTGDLVSHADKGHYDLALSWLRRANLGVAFVVAPGNHDIRDGESLFENLIGLRQFAFRWGPVDIVVVDNAVAPPDERAVEGMLSAAKGPILVFMHVPPHETTMKKLVAKSAYKGFVEMIRKYPVKYIFSGHAHGYTRIDDGGIVLIANGVGGDSDSWQFNQKAYLTIVEADGNTMKDRSIVIEPVIGIRANLEHLAIGHVGEIVLRRIWGIPALVGLIILLYLLRPRKARPPPPPPPSKEPGKRIPVHIIEPPDIVI